MTNIRSGWLLIFPVVLFLLSNPLRAQTARPKIGLVLSGGGAKGIAHIGILKAMEKAGLRPDYIAGTSMGAVVGALYSIGYNSAQLEKILTGIHWDEVLANSIPLNKIVMEEKPYYGRYLAELPTDHFKPRLPSGVIEGQNLQELFFDLTRPVHSITDFSRFPIPFVCLATDIATGKPVVLSNGNLARSIRASMAIPAAFTPVEIEGKLLVDGGLVNNFPVDEVIKMGADIVIGVFVSSDLRDKQSLKTLTSILFQSSFVMSAYNTRAQKEKVNYYIEPDLTGMGTASFSATDRILKQGILSGEAYFPAFKRLADSLDQLGTQNPVQLIPHHNEYFIRNTQVRGNQLLPAEFVTAKFNLRDSSTYTAVQIEDKISILFGRGYFDNIGYQLQETDTGFQLRVDVKEAVPGKLKTAIHFDTENKAGINVNYTLRNTIGAASRLVLEADLAEFPRFSGNYLKYLGKKQNLALIGDFSYSKFEPVIRDENNRKSLFTIREYRFTGSLISSFATNYNYGIDFLYNSLKMKPEATDDLTRTIRYVKNKEFSLKAYFRSDNTDRRYFPRKGTITLVSAAYYFGARGKIAFELDSSYRETKYSIPDALRAELFGQRLFPVNPRISLIATGDLTLATHKTSIEYNTIGLTFFGGFRPRIRNAVAFYGATNYAYTASSYLMAKLDIQLELTRKLFLTAGFNYLNVRQPMELLNKNYNQLADLGGDASWRLGYGLSLGYLTLVGPISISAGMDQRRGVPVANFSVGFYF